MYTRRKPSNMMITNPIQATTNNHKMKAADVRAPDQESHILSFDAFTNGPGECSLRHYSDIVSHQSLNGQQDGQNTFVTHQESGCMSVIKKSIDNVERSDSQPNRSAPEPSHVMLCGWLKQSEGSTSSELCSDALSNILNSDKFSELCGLLLKNLGVANVKQVLDIDAISSMIKNGAYETSPLLYLKDIQQVWTKLQQVGSDIITLANNLSHKSRAHYNKVNLNKLTNRPINEPNVQVRLHSRIVRLYGNKRNTHEQIYIIMNGHDHTNKKTSFANRSCSFGSFTSLQLQSQTPCSFITFFQQFTKQPTSEAHVCHECGEKADVFNCLVCDSCEDIYHLPCIGLLDTAVPPLSWYCTRCVSNGVESPHNNCMVCEKLNTSTSTPLVNRVPTTNQSHVTNENQSSNICFMCKAEVKMGDEFRKCEHLQCGHKFYHSKCLSSRQLGLCGTVWYCPSCLCRRCRVDKDDDQIVLCDMCDEAYHIYCASPQLLSIPKGSWFCRKCDRKLNQMKTMRRVYESMQKKVKIEDGLEERHEEMDEREGLDMLVNAAKSLSYPDAFWNTRSSV
ncbi:PHD finger protein EHD3-like [Bidens hawaiensis]|uniref:PHD finger protein EHD3-like n=1 Tax=Bidens hawaiensis TaxID=980011 RepID=UPI00404B9193